MWPDLCHHPLAYVRMIRNWSQEDLARLIRQAAERRDLRNGTDRNRIWKWESGRVEEPDAFSQELLAEVLDVPLDVVAALGWPWWLPAYTLDEPLWDFPGRSVAAWSPAATLESLESVTGGPMDRRSFLIASSGTVAAAAATWAGNAPFAAASPTAGRRIGASTADLFDARLEGLRRLDDRLGSAEVHQAARAELRLITSTLKDASYSETTERRLYAAAAEAGRICGWTVYDSSHHAAAERHYLASLRAAGHTDDRAVGATVLAFWAGLRYNRNDPHGALGILDAVTATADRRTGSPRVTALLHARTARAHAKADNRYGAHQAVDASFGAYARATPADQDVPSMSAAPVSSASSSSLPVTTDAAGRGQNPHSPVCGAAGRRREVIPMRCGAGPRARGRPRRVRQAGVGRHQPDDHHRRQQHRHVGGGGREDGPDRT